MPRGSGRRPKPTAVRKLQGNAGKRKLNEAEPIAALGVPDMPEGLPPAAREEWLSIVPQLEELGVLAKIDGKALGAYCFAFARWLEAELETRKYGIVIREPIVRKVWKKRKAKGKKKFVWRDEEVVVGHRYKRNPAVTIAFEAMKLMKAFLIEFGMTPAARSRIHVVKPKVAAEQDEFDNFLLNAEARVN